MKSENRKMAINRARVMRHRRKINRWRDIVDAIKLLIMVVTGVIMWFAFIFSFSIIGDIMGI